MKPLLFLEWWNKLRFCWVQSLPTHSFAFSLLSIDFQNSLPKAKFPIPTWRSDSSPPLIVFMYIAVLSFRSPYDPIWLFFSYSSFQVEHKLLRLGMQCFRVKEMIWCLSRQDGYFYIHSDLPVVFLMEMLQTWVLYFSRGLNCGPCVKRPNSWHNPPECDLVLQSKF